MIVTNATTCQQYVIQAANTVNKVNVFTNYNVNYPQLPVLCTVLVLFTFINIHPKINQFNNVQSTFETLIDKHYTHCVRACGCMCKCK
jgi:hypothetical protein